jgi:hypothetical protein
MESQTSILLTAERRRSPRMSTTIPALIFVRPNAPLCPCTVLDVSQGGGRVRVEAPMRIPDHFYLLFTRTATVRRECRVVWRHENYMGVAFAGRFDTTQAEVEAFVREYQST